MAEDLDTRLYELLSNLLGLPADEITDESSMKTVRAWDSLKHMELIFALEQTFDLPQLSTDEIVEMTSVERIRTVLREKCACV